MHTEDSVNVLQCGGFCGSWPAFGADSGGAKEKRHRSRGGSCAVLRFLWAGLLGGGVLGFARCGHADGGDGEAGLGGEPFEAFVEHTDDLGTVAVA